MAPTTKQDHAVTESTPIKTTLFRFATIRSPQLICEGKKKWGYIFHPNPSHSHFLKSIGANDDIDTERSVVQRAAATFKDFLQIDEIKKSLGELYNFSCWLSKNRNTLDEKIVSEKIKNVPSLTHDQLINLWDNLFYELEIRQNHFNRQAYIQLIIANNFVVSCGLPDIKSIAEAFILTPKTPYEPNVEIRLPLFLQRLAKSMIVVPRAFSVKKLDTDDTAKNDTDEVKLFGVNKLGIAVLRKVEQEVCCYVPGEVSRIENILAREYKERQTRSLISTEDTTEETTELEVETQTDTATTTRYELQKEISDMATKDSSISVGASLGVEQDYKLFGQSGSINVDGSFDWSSSTSSSSSDSEAQSYAEEVTNSASERVLQKTSSKRTSKILQEFEENNRHGFDNREGSEHVTGVYRWIDLIYKNRLINYGKRLMFEFLIPEPAKLYRQVLENKISESILPGDELIAPVHPSTYNLNDAGDIEGYDESESLYFQKIAALYGVEISAPAAEVVYMEQTLTQSGLDKNKFGSSSIVPIPTGYRCRDFKCLTSFYYEPSGNDAAWYVQVGGTVVLRKDDVSSGGSNPEFNDYEDNFSLDDFVTTSVGLSVYGDQVYSFNISVTLKCEIVPEEYSNWQNNAYKAIMDAYEAQLSAYEGLCAETEKKSNAQYNQRTGSNKKFNRTVEQRELKRIAIEMLTKPYDIPMGNSFYFNQEIQCGKIQQYLPVVKQTAAWEVYSSRVKFFEQAFDWSLMSYLFYPYYWADKCEWYDLFQVDPSEDQVFEAFLQSGMARAVIPVRKGFEKAVSYYLETGDIWNGDGLVMHVDDDLYLSIEEELREIEGFVEKEWPTRVPTTLTIVQGKSVYLEDESLPCCNDVEEGTDTLLRSSTAILGTSTE